MSKFGQYQLFDRIAIGGMAEVFRGRAAGEEGFEKQVAIKRILPSFAQDGRFISMLVTEARIHSQLTHRNIVQIQDLGVSEDGEYFIVLEYVDGHDLGALLTRLAERRARAATPAQLADAVALYIAIELGEGLHYAHELSGPDGPLGLVHRDISPSNVLLSYAGEVKLSDFGLAKRRTDHSVVGSLKGKLAYMSPEQARRAPIDRRSDLFALGAVLYEMLTGHPLREIADNVAGWQQVASGLVPPARRMRPDISPALERLVARMLEPDPRDRFPDARAFVDEARAALEVEPRSRIGEAGELQALLRALLPPGTARPARQPSRVIRLLSEIVSTDAAQALGGDLTVPGTDLEAGQSDTSAVTSIAPMPSPVMAASDDPAASIVTPPPPPVPTPPPPPISPGTLEWPRTPPPPPPRLHGPPIASEAGVTPALPARTAAGLIDAPAPEAPPASVSEEHRIIAAWPSLLAGDRPPPPPSTAPEMTPPLGGKAPPTPSPPIIPPFLPAPSSPGVIPPLPPVPPVPPAADVPAPFPPARLSPPAAFPVATVPAPVATGKTKEWMPPPLPAALPPIPGATPRRGSPLPAAPVPSPSGAPPSPFYAPPPAPHAPPPALHARPTERSSTTHVHHGRRPLVGPALTVALPLFGLAVVAAVVHVAVVPLEVLAVWRTPARLSIRSEPSGAEVFLDERRLSARTPAYVEIDRDRRPHLLELRYPGYAPRTVPLRFDRTVKLEVATILAPLPPPEPPPAPPPPPALPVEPPPTAPVVREPAASKPVRKAKGKKAKGKKDRRRAGGARSGGTR